MTVPEFGTMYFDEQSKEPSFFGYACTHLV